MSQKKTSQKEDKSEDDGSEEEKDEVKEDEKRMKIRPLLHKSSKMAIRQTLIGEKLDEKSGNLIRMRSSMEFQYHTPMIGI